MTDLGSVLGVVSAVAVPASLGVQYLRGKWPYIRNNENVYLISRLFTGHKGPVLDGLKTSLYLTPFIRIVKDKEGNNITVPKQPQVFDFKKSSNGIMKYVTKEGFDGVLENCQFTYVIPSKKNAKKCGTALSPLHRTASINHTLPVMD